MYSVDIYSRVRRVCLKDPAATTEAFCDGHMSAFAFLVGFNHLWATHFQHFAAKSTRGPKPKTRHKDQLTVLLLDLYVAWTTDPTLAIGVHLNNSEWRTNSRYNALHLSKVIVEYVHLLAELGLIDLSKGSYSGPGAATNRNARIRAAAPLRAMFHAAKFGLADLGHTPDRECIILRGEDGKSIDYEDTDDTRRRMPLWL